MLGINSNINSLVAQQNLNGSQDALSQAITRLSSGKRINSAADDAAGLAIATGMQTQINGLNQGVSNANNAVSMIQTASSGLSQITSSLQRIRQLAVQASSGGLTDDNRAALQQEVAQQISEVNRIASQTQFNGQNILDGSAGNVSFQVGANVGQNVNLNLAQSVSAASLGGGAVQAGSVVASLSVSLDSTGAAWNAATSTGTELTQINALSDGKGGFTFTDQNGNALSFDPTAGGATSLLTKAANGSLSINTGGALGAANEIGAINTANAGNAFTAGTTLGTITGLNIDPTTGANAAAGVTNTITSITVKSDGNKGYTFFDQNGNQLAASSATVTTGLGYVAPAGATPGAMTLAGTVTQAAFTVSSTAQTQTVDQSNVSTTAGATATIEAIDNALTTVNNIQATVGAAQNRFTAISTTQQAQSTDLSTAQSQIQDADFAQETANLSKAQVLQQAGISVLAQANSLPQQVLKLLQ